MGTRVRLLKGLQKLVFRVDTESAAEFCTIFCTAKGAEMEKNETFVLNCFWLRIKV